MVPVTLSKWGGGPGGGPYYGGEDPKGAGGQGKYPGSPWKVILKHKVLIIDIVLRIWNDCIEM